jgi:transcriptional regulator
MGCRVVRHLNWRSAVFTPEMKKGSVELLILSLLEAESRHGYELGKLIESRSHGRLVFQISSLYPVLCRMEDRGWIKGRWVEKDGQRRRKYYRLTRDGQKVLEAKQATWLEFAESVNQVLGLARG